MSVQLATATRNAMLNAIETEIGNAPILKLRTGAPPANCAAADAGTVLCTITLPADWLTSASSGSMPKNGTWQGTASGGGGTVAHFRIYDSGGSNCRLQGSVGEGSGDLSVNDAVLVDGQIVTIATFTLTAANS